MIIVSLFSLFVSILLIQLSSGGLGPMDVLSGVARDFSTEQIGLMGSAHFAGFFIGCWWAPRLIGAIGHSRAFAVFAAAGTIGTLAHMLWVDPYAWSAMRILSGMCVAGCITVIEAWLQAKVTNTTRGRVLGIYRVVDLVGGLCSQMVIAVLEPAHYISYNILAIFCCASLLPLALTRVQQPATPDRLRLRPGLAYRISPMATFGVIVAGITTSGFRMVGPVYGIEVGLAPEQLAFFLASFILGGAIAQYPAGWLADRFDRRKVMIGFSVAAILSCGFSVTSAGYGPSSAFLAAIILGMTTFPVYSLAAAHANDFVDPGQVVELSSSLLFHYALGAIGSPLIIALAVSNAGPMALFVIIAVGHVALCGFALFRMTIRPSAEKQGAYVYMPRTSFFFARLLKRRGNGT